MRSPGRLHSRPLITQLACHLAGNQGAARRLTSMSNKILKLFFSQILERKGLYAELNKFDFNKPEVLYPGDILAMIASR